LVASQKKEEELHLMKKLLLALSLILALPAMALAAPTVQLDGQPLTFEVAPIIEDGRTLVPLRAIFEALGATVSWDAETQTATAVKGDTTVVITIGSTEPTVNGEVTTLDVPAKIVEDRTLAPLRFVGEAFGGTVGYDADTELITINTGSEAAVETVEVTPESVETIDAAPEQDDTESTELKDVELQ
jgi:hypothetical protein